MNGRQPRTGDGGFSLLELLIAALFLAMTLPAALDALQLSVRYADAGLQDDVYYWSASSAMERVSAQPFSNLKSAAAAAGNISVPTSYSDAPGAQPRVLVYLSEYDGDNADADNDPLTGTDPNLLLVRVTLEQNPSVVLENLVAQ